MSATSIDVQILQSLPLLGKDEKNSLLKVIQSFLKLKDTSVGSEPGIDIDEYNREIDEAKAEIERGKFYTQDEVEAFFENKWKQCAT